MKKTINFIDHYDSFSNNLIEWLEASEDFKVKKYFYDDKSITNVNHSSPLVLSPGPNSPNECDSTINLVKSLIGKVPILGICLGHQLLGHLAGFDVCKVQLPFHGSKRKIYIKSKAGIFENCDDFIELATYNSLCLQGNKANIGEWSISALNQFDEIEAIENWSNPLSPAIGLQSHPESFLSSSNFQLFENWKKILLLWYQQQLP